PRDARGGGRRARRPGDLRAVHCKSAGGAQPPVYAAPAGGRAAGVSFGGQRRADPLPGAAGRGSVPAFGGGARDPGARRLGSAGARGVPAYHGGPDRRRRRGRGGAAWPPERGGGGRSLGRGGGEGRKKKGTGGRV